MSDLRLDAALAGTAARIEEFPNGGVVFVKDDRGDCAYVVKAGKVEIREAGRGLEVIRAGEIFGEMALVDGGPRSASAVAIGATELMVIDRPTFNRLVRNDPDFAIAVMSAMARRLRAMNASQRPAEDLPIRVKPRHSA